MKGPAGHWDYPKGHVEENETEKEGNNGIEYELKAAEAFENFDMIYDKLGDHNITKEEILGEMRSER